MRKTFTFDSICFDLGSSGCFYRNNETLNSTLFPYTYVTYYNRYKKSWIVVDFIHQFLSEVNMTIFSVILQLCWHTFYAQNTRKNYLASFATFLLVTWQSIMILFTWRCVRLLMFWVLRVIVIFKIFILWNVCTSSCLTHSQITKYHGQYFEYGAAFYFIFKLHLFSILWSLLKVKMMSI